MFKVKKFFTLVLALALTMGLAVPASAAGDTAQRGVLTYSEPIAPWYDDALSFSEGLALVGFIMDSYEQEDQYYDEATDTYVPAPPTP